MNISFTISPKDLQSYQQEAVDRVLLAIDHMQKAIIFCMPVGTGKTTVTMFILQQYLSRRNGNRPVKILILTSNKALQHQIADRMRPNPVIINLSNLIEQANIATDQIAVLNIQTLYREQNLKAFHQAMPQPEMIIYDGLHSYTPLVKQLVAHYSNATHLLTTNEPESSEIFGEPVFIYSFSSAIKNGVFLPVRVETFNIAEQTPLEPAIKVLLERINGQKTIIYAKTISDVENIRTIITTLTGNQKYSIAVISLQDADHPSNALYAYQTADLPVILCAVAPNSLNLSLPCTRNIAILHTPKNKLHLQSMLISGIRPFENKSFLNVLDFAGLENLFKELHIEDTTNEAGHNSSTPTKTVEEYFAKTLVRFRDKKDIEGVMGVHDLSAELAEIIQIMPAEQGTMIGIFGQWGRGKSFLLEETWKKLRSKGQFERVDFHAWKFQDTPATWAYLYECIAEVYLKPVNKYWLCRKWLSGWRHLSLIWNRKGFLPLLKFLTIVSAGVISYLLSKQLAFINPANKKGLLTWSGVSLSIATLYALGVAMKKEFSTKAKDLFSTYTTRHSYKEQLGLQAEIQSETVTLLKTWISNKKANSKKIVLFVEDLDRCLETKIIQVIDSLRVLLEDPEIAERIIVISAVDERILKMAIRLKYHSLVTTGNSDMDQEKRMSIMIREYIDKLFISGLKLGPLSMTDTDEFFAALTKQDRLDKPMTELADLLLKEESREFYRYSEQIRQNTYDDPSNYPEEEYYDDVEPDYAIEYLENSELIPETSTTDGQTETADIRISALSDEEIDILRVSINKFVSPTPRQLRIFYYRYLIAKNLLIRRYASMKRSNVWQKKSNCQILARLIVAYTQENDDKLLTEHLDAALLSKSDRMYVQMVKETMIQTLDYREALKILSVVIAY